MSEDRVKFQGRDVMEAVMAAREHFGVTRRDLGYEVVSEKQIGRVEDMEDATVTIEAWKEGNAHPPRDFSSEERGGFRRDGDGGRDRDRGGRGGAGRGRESRDGRGRDRDRDRGRDRDRPQPPREPEEEFVMPELLPPADVTDAKQILTQLTGSLLAGMDVDLQLEEIVESEIGLRVRLTGGDVPLLLESDAEGLEAIQYLVNRILQRDGRLRIRVSFDAGDHRAKQEERLLEKARRFAEEVTESGEVRKMPPMGPYERRLVHMALDDVEGIRTYSAGSGFQRRLHVAPEISAEGSTEKSAENGAENSAKNSAENVAEKDASNGVDNNAEDNSGQNEE